MVMEDQIGSLVVVVLNKPRKDYSFRGNLSHSYIWTLHKVSPFYDAMRWKRAIIQSIYFDALIFWESFNTELSIALLHFYFI